MKKSACAFFLALLSGPVAFSSELTLEQAVANNIQGLVWDTVNEGSQTAKVVYEEGKPSVSCKISPVKGEASKRWAFCFVDFEVTFDDSEEVIERGCRLLYSFDSSIGVKSLQRENEDLISDCLETLGEGIE